MIKRKWKYLGIALLLLFVVIQLLPFYIASTVAFKPMSDMSSRWIFPIANLSLKNFEIAIERGNIFNAMKNSLIVTVTSVFFICILGSMAAYPLARVKTKLNTIIMIFILGLMMIPPLSTLVPTLSLLNKFNATNTYWGISLIMITGQLPLSIFLYKSFIGSIPKELEEAALIDGASRFQIYTKIILPMLKPVTASVIILTGTFIWNDYQMSLYIMNKPEARTVTTAIGSFFSQQASNMGAASAASLLGVLPILIVYLLLQKYFIKGMVDGAVKG